MTSAWQHCTLGDVCAIEKMQGEHRGLPYVGLEHIESGTGRFIGSLKPERVKSSTFRFSSAHLLYGRLRPYLNKVLAPDFDGHCSTEIFPLKPSPRVLRAYVQYWLQAKTTVARIDATCTGARMPRANMSDVMKLEFPLPTLPEQRRIVAILDEAFAGLEAMRANAEKNLQNAREFFGSYLSSLYRVDWPEKSLEEACIIGDGNHSSNYPKKEELVDSGIPFIRATNLVNGRISGLDMRFLTPEKHAQLKKGHLKAGDVLLTNRGEIGKIALVDQAYDNANLNSQIAWLRCRADTDSKYLFYVLQTEEIQSHFQGSKSGTALQQFTIRQLKALRLRVPPLSTQRQIAASADAVIEETSLLESLYKQKLAAIDELKQSILQKAFSGEQISSEAVAA